MTNEVFLENLRGHMHSPQDAKTTTDLAVAFLEGCAEELKIYVMCVKVNETIQPFITGEADRRMMLCCTAAEEVAKFDPPKGSGILCMQMSSHMVLDTVLARADVQALGFDMDSDHACVIPKPVFEALVKKA